MFWKKITKPDSTEEIGTEKLLTITMSDKKGKEDDYTVKEKWNIVNVDDEEQIRDAVDKIWRYRGYAYNGYIIKHVIVSDIPPETNYRYNYEIEHK